MKEADPYDFGAVEEALNDAYARPCQRRLSHPSRAVRVCLHRDLHGHAARAVFAMAPVKLPIFKC